MVLASCGIVGDQSQAFSVDGSGYSRDGLNALVKALAAANQLTVAKDLADGDDVRSVVNVMVQYKSGERVLAGLGKSITDADRDAVLAGLTAQLPPGMDPGVVSLLVDISATGQALDKVAAPSETELKAMYEASPASTGMLCIRELSVKTREQAVDVVRQLDEGADFAALARKVSLSKSTKTDGGAVTSAFGNPCQAIPATGEAKNVGDALTRELLRTSAGANTGIVQAGAGWRIAVHRPFAEIKDELVSAVSERPGRMLMAGVMATSDIRINPVYGTWNPVAAKVE